MGYEYRIRRDAQASRYVECPLVGDALVHNPVFNKGTAFTAAERDEFGLRGLLPPRITTLAEQVDRVLADNRRRTDALERYSDLLSLLDENETLFYRVVLDHLEELLPIVYTPTVGLACAEFGRIYRRPRGIYLTPDDRGRVAAILAHWPYRDVRVIVVTDGERILGLGDLGANGMGIPIGKLVLYVAAGSVHPSQVLPICLDVGTDQEALLRDSNYLGIRQPRVRGASYDALVEEFIRAASECFPGVLVQFEDFAGPNALRLLDRFRQRARCFNDDVQGTGAVVLATVLASERVTGRRLADERFVIAGAGGAGMGIARALAAAIGDEDAVRRQMWLVDSRGLVVPSHDPRDAHKQAFARPGTRIPLAEVVRTARPTVLVGVSTRGGLFTPEILSQLAERPLVLPLSNPTPQAECTPEAVERATRGQGLVATGSPFAGTSQCNNVYIFPGVGLGVLAAGAPEVTDRMFTEAARGLAARCPDDALSRGYLLPPIREIRQISAAVAGVVAREAGFAGPIEQWEPSYLPYRRAPAAAQE
jgi:malate dehydrogenase (oxaloacetate-decarboxylating)(NADP+)